VRPGVAGRDRMDNGVEAHTEDNQQLQQAQRKKKKGGMKWTRWATSAKAMKKLTFAHGAAGKLTCLCHMVMTESLTRLCIGNAKRLNDYQETPQEQNCRF